MSPHAQQFLADMGGKTPVICGPMYPGSNPELVAVLSEAGGFGVFQSVALTSLYGNINVNGFLNEAVIVEG